MKLALKQSKLRQKSLSFGNKTKSSSALQYIVKTEISIQQVTIDGFTVIFHILLPSKELQEKKWMKYKIMHPFDRTTQSKFQSLHWLSSTGNALKDRGRYSGIICQLIPEKADEVRFNLGWAARLLCDPECFPCDAIYWPFTNGIITLMHPFKGLQGKLSVALIILQSCWDF